MKAFISSLIAIIGLAAMSYSQTAHEVFMSSKIKSVGDWNNWEHGDNEFATITANNWNTWNYKYMGLEGIIETQTANDYTNWEISNAGITISNGNGDLNAWTISGENHTVNLTTANWNTWVITGDVISGINTTDTGDFTEWDLNGGDWTSLSPNFRAATVFISVISSSVLQSL